MPAVGDTQIKFNRVYIWLKPNTNGPGTWRLTGNDNTPNSNSTNSDLIQNGTVAADSPAIAVNAAVYIKADGTIGLASASSAATGRVAGLATTASTAGGPISYTRNQAVNITNVGSIVDGAPSSLEQGKYYFLSTNPGKLTRTPDTSTAGAVLVQLGLATSSGDLSVEIQNPLVI